ncbi:MAG: hypothetical protein ACLP9L_31595 [Thermoguttaceae bacterium]
MLPDLTQVVRPHQDAPQTPPHRVCWSEVGLDGCLQVPVPLLPPAEWPDALRLEIEQADSPRPKAAEPGLDAQQDDSRAKVQRGSWMGCGSSRDLATVVPRHPRVLRLLRLHVLHLLRLRVRRLRVQKPLLPRGMPQWTRQGEELWIFSRCHLFYLLRESAVL